MIQKIFKQALTLIAIALLSASCADYNKHIGQPLLQEESAIASGAIKVYFKNDLYPYDVVQKELVYLLVSDTYEGENAKEVKLRLQSTQPLSHDVKVQLLYNEDVKEAKGGRTLLTKEQVDLSKSVVTFPAGKQETEIGLLLITGEEPVAGNFMLPIKVALAEKSSDVAVSQNFATVTVMVNMQKSWKGAVEVANTLPEGLTKIELGAGEVFKSGTYKSPMPQLSDGNFKTGPSVGHKAYGINVSGFVKKVKAIGFSPLYDENKSTYHPFITKITDVKVTPKGEGSISFGAFEFAPISSTDPLKPDTRYIVFKKPMTIQELRLDLAYDPHDWDDIFGLSEITLYQ